MRSVERRLVWILGSPRSGSTWLLKMLAEHPRVVPINEPQIGLHLAPFVSDWPGWDPSEVGDEFTFNRLARKFHIYFFSRQHESVWLPDLRRMICRRISVYGNRRSLFAIKEPNGSQAADVILRALPRSHLLFLLRDGRDVVDSELAASVPGSWLSGHGSGFAGIEDTRRTEFLAQAAHKWVWRTKVVREAFAVHSGPKLQVRYEDLLAAPAEHLARIVTWMGLDDSDVPAIVARHEFTQGGQHGPKEFARAANPGGWRENLRRDEQEVVQALMEPELREFGYL